MTVPAAAARAQIDSRVDDALGILVGTRWRLSAALIEKVGSLAAYFDGDTTDNELTRYSWESTANASASTQETRSVIPQTCASRRVVTGAKPTHTLSA